MAWTPEQKAALSKQRGQAATYIKDSAQKQKYLSEQGDVEAQHGGNAPDHEYERMSRNAEDTIATQGAKQDTHARSEVSGGTPSYKTGTARVPKTGPAILHKDEAVLTKDDADKYRTALGHAAHALGGDHKHPKTIHEIRTRRSSNGGYIHEHHHTHPEEHAMEEHTSPDQDAMVAHMMQNMGSQTSGEADADAGQAGAAPNAAAAV